MNEWSLLAEKKPEFTVHTNANGIKIGIKTLTQLVLSTNLLKAISGV